MEKAKAATQYAVIATATTDKMSVKALTWCQKLSCGQQSNYDLRHLSIYTEGCSH